MAISEETRMVVGVFRLKESADGCFDALIARGYASSEITLIMSDETRQAYEGVEDGRLIEPPDPTRDLIGTSAGSHSLEGIGVGGVIGTAIGATLAAVTAIGTSLLIPGLNLIVAGPLAAALAGGGAGALTGGLMGGLIGLGLPEQDAQVYNEALTGGGVVISITPRDPADFEAIEKIMIEHSGQQVCSC